MKLLLPSMWLFAATAIPLTMKDSRCEELQKKLGEMAYRAHGFPNDNCATDQCPAVDSEARTMFYAETRALALQIHDTGCKPEVDATAQIQRRDEQPQYISACTSFYSQLVNINEKLDDTPITLSDGSDRKCAIARESLPEIDIWSNRCASSTPKVGREAVNLVTSLHRLGCVWNSTCGTDCFEIGTDMFHAVRDMGPMQCNRFDPAVGPHKMDTKRLTL